MLDIGRIEFIALVAELAIDLDLATTLIDQRKGIVFAQADQRITGALAGATATKLQ
ncbi:hypothetical protein D3C77_771820 [compost metagenome]